MLFISRGILAFLDDRFEIQPSGLNTGDGFFARAPIARGDFIIEYIGKKIPTRDTHGHPSRYLFEIDDEWTIEGPTEINSAGYINHGCEPNVEAAIEETGGEKHINIYALRDIAPGEELLMDYGEEYFEEFIKPIGCACPAKIHRK